MGAEKAESESGARQGGAPAPRHSRPLAAECGEMSEIGHAGADRPHAPRR